MNRLRCLLLAGAILLAATIGVAVLYEPPGIDDPALSAPMPSRLNINTATADQLSQIPGIGWTLAERIVETREQTGEFRSIEELFGVSGVSWKMIERWEQYLTVSEENS